MEKTQLIPDKKEPPTSLCVIGWGAAETMDTLLWMQLKFTNAYLPVRNRERESPIYPLRNQCVSLGFR